jgi:hypothetical protein
MLLAATSLTRNSKESSEKYLQRVTHLHLQAKKIKKIEGLELCAGLKVIQASHARGYRSPCIMTIMITYVMLCYIVLCCRCFTYMTTRLKN